MAKKKFKYRTRYAKRSRRRNNSGGGYKPMIDGFLAGAAGGLVNRFVPQVKGLGMPLAAVGVGFWRKNQILKVEGSRELGAVLVNMLLGGNGGGNGGGGAY